MAVTITRAGTLDPQVQRLNLSGASTYYVYRNGVLSEITSRPWVDVTLASGEQATIEVFDAAGTPTTAYSGNVTLQWDEVAGATQYRVDKYVASVWTQKALYGDTGQAVYQYVTEYLADDTEHIFRVVPVLNGNDGQARTFTFRMVRVPDAPQDVVWSYAEGAVTAT